MNKVDLLYELIMDSSTYEAWSTTPTKYICDMIISDFKKKSPLNKSPLYFIINLLKSAESNYIQLPTNFGIKIGSCILVDREVVLSITEHHYTELQSLYLLYNKCVFGTQFPPDNTLESRIFLGKNYNDMIYRYMLIKTIIIPDISNIICQNFIG